MAAAKKPAAKPAGVAKKAAPAVSLSDGVKPNIRELLEGMRKSIGEENVLLLGGGAEALKIRGVISTRAPEVDEAIGRGGIPLGRITILHGGEGSGKTTLCLQTVAECQAQGGTGAYYDTEHKLDPDYAHALGVDDDNLIIVRPETLEGFFDSANSFMDLIIAQRLRTGTRAPCIMVLDSINSTIAKCIVEGDAGDQQYAPEARIWSKQLTKLNRRISQESVALVLISQVRKKIGIVFGDPDEIAGGQAPRFYASLIMKVTRTGSEVTDGEKTANKTQVECKKNQISPPFKKAQVLIKYGRGVDFARSLLMAATRSGLISKTGNTYSIGEEKIGIGEGAATKWLRKNVEVKDRINKQWRELKGWPS
jgi:recombination protein RecA